MNIDFSKIVADKIAQMDSEGIIQQKIEECVERSVLGTIESELGGWNFRTAVQTQLRESIGEVAKELGLAGYNGYIAQAVQAIVTDMQQKDLADKVRAALEGVMLKKYENVKLSEIFEKYREWVRGWVDESDWAIWETFTAELVEHHRCHPFEHYTCRFAEEAIDADEKPDIEIVIRRTTLDTVKITSLFLNGHDLRDTLHIGLLSEFEAFVANLFYNSTQIILDVDDVGDDCSFETDR